ncbi:MULTISPECIES: LacI family DNA-binding transcriptional regulator [Dyella]|uniref:LacI family transcriptional regulator n=2 Tax=Dyella TaxID=231454 RepID=A0A4R0YJ98_9GAMM|nr:MULTISPECIES: LacI family DNA-binding transcriptional regulator [Dyella]TBR35912.1 LacI family transcriptional regulator [Dyella terrae]TCI08540.1 LacI family transcriptional regulator [Dyella soli]
MGVTIKDVAREAKVSVASVSRALNGHGGVTAETLERIREVAARLRYIPHGAARSLITRRTHTIGALLPDLYGEFFSELIRGIDLAARTHGLQLLVSSSHDGAAEAATALRAMQGRVDGLLVMSPHADAAFLRQNLPAGLPTVLMNTLIDGNDYAALSVDNSGGARLMVEHLADAGYQRIAFIQGPASNRDVAERERAYHAVLTERAMVPIVLPGDFNEESGYRSGQALVAMSPRPDAVFAANDMMAIGCMAAIRDAGLRIPEDIAVAGFDDVPMARYVSPALTTVRVRIADLGREALEQLTAQIDDHEDNPAPRTHVRVSAELMVRASTAPPR